MKIRKVKTESNSIQQSGGGCCGSTPQVQVQSQSIQQSSCCGPISESVKEVAKPKFGGGCCG